MEALATPSSCPECRGDGYRVEAELRLGSGDGDGGRARAVARVCRCREPCPHCKGRGFLYTSRQVEFSKKVGPKTYEALAPCVCRLLAQRVSAFAQVGIPAHHATSSFGTFRAKGDDQEKTAALEQALGVARSVAQEWRRDRPARSRGSVVAPHTVDAHLKHMYVKLGIHSRVELTVLDGWDRLARHVGSGDIGQHALADDIHAVRSDNAGAGAG